MSMIDVKLVVFVCLVLAAALIAAGVLAPMRVRAGRALLVLLAAAVIVAVLYQRLVCVRVIEKPQSEMMVTESYPIAEDGVSVEVVGGRYMSSTWYSILTRKDDGLEALTLPAYSVTVYEDASSWEEARVDELYEVTASAGGTFFGVPVEGTRVTDARSPEYQIHVPKGAFER